MADIASSIDLRDPLGAPPDVDRSRYLEALGRLGWNAENMNSNLPFAVANMKNMNTLLTYNMQQQLDWQSTQAESQLRLAQADHLTQQTDQAKAELENRLKLLDYDTQIKADQARASRETIDGMIRAQQHKSEMQPLIDDATLAAENLKRQDYEDSLHERQIALERQQKAMTQRRQALDELPKSSDPDYHDKMVANMDKYPDVWGDPITSPLMIEEMKARDQARATNQIVIQRNQDAADLQKAKDAHYLGAGTDVNALSMRHDDATAALRGANIHRTLDRVQTLIAQLQGIAPEQLGEQMKGLLGFAQTMQGILKNPEQGFNDIMVGVHGGFLDADGNLTPRLEGDIKAMEDWYTNYVKRGEALPEGRKIVTKPGPTGRPQTEIETTRVPAGQEQAEIEEQRRILAPTPAPTPAAPTPGATPTPEFLGTSRVIQDLIGLHPEFRTMLLDAQKTGNWKPVFEAMGIRSGPRMQEGGLVGTRPGLAKQGGGMIFDPSSVGAGLPRTATGSTDTVPAMLSPGEYVVSAPAVQAVGQGTLEAINQTGQGMQVSAAPQLTSISSTPLGPGGPSGPGGVGGRLATPLDRIAARQQPTGAANIRPLYGQPATTTPSTTAPSTTAPADTATPVSATPTAAEETGAASVIPMALRMSVAPVTGSEFGEVDNPSRGGQPMSNWNVGAWGDSLSGESNQGVALPASVLSRYGNPQDKNFASNFNSKYRIVVTDPSTGKTTTAPLKDVGPGAAGRGIDLLWGTRASLGLPSNSTYNLQYNIVPIGGEGMQQGGLVDPYAHRFYLPGKAPRGEVAPAVPQPHPRPDPRPDVKSAPLSKATVPGTKDPMAVSGQEEMEKRLEGKNVMQPPTQMQRGGVVSEEGSIGTPGRRGGFGGGRAGRGGGIESELDQPIQPSMRHRRFHPRVGAPGQLGALGPDIPDPMQKKLAKLSQGYLSGLSDLIRQRPEMGPALLHHARRQLAANMGGQPEDWAGGAGSEIAGEQMGKGMGGMGGMGVPPEMFAGSRAAAYGAEGGGEEPQYMQYGGAVTGMPEDLMNTALLDPERMGINFQRGGPVADPVSMLAQSQNQLTNMLSMMFAQ